MGGAGKKDVWGSILVLGGKNPGLEQLRFQARNEANSWHIDAQELVVVRQKQVSSHLSGTGQVDRVGRRRRETATKWPFPFRVKQS
jgi:hypothetical protein